MKKKATKHATKKHAGHKKAAHHKGKKKGGAGTVKTGSYAYR